MIPRIEGIGIVSSECPTCKQPGWKNDLRPNHKMQNIAGIVKDYRASHPLGAWVSSDALSGHTAALGCISSGHLTAQSVTLVTDALAVVSVPGANSALVLLLQTRLPLLFYAMGVGADAKPQLPLPPPNRRPVLSGVLKKLAQPVEAAHPAPTRKQGATVSPFTSQHAGTGATPRLVLQTNGARPTPVVADRQFASLQAAAERSVSAACSGGAGPDRDSSGAVSVRVALPCLQDAGADPVSPCAAAVTGATHQPSPPRSSAVQPLSQGETSQPQISQQQSSRGTPPQGAPLDVTASVQPDASAAAAVAPSAPASQTTQANEATAAAADTSGGQFELSVEPHNSGPPVASAMMDVGEQPLAVAAEHAVRLDTAPEPTPSQQELSRSLPSPISSEGHAGDSSEGKSSPRGEMHQWYLHRGAPPEVMALHQQVCSPTLQVYAFLRHPLCCC